MYFLETTAVSEAVTRMCSVKDVLLKIWQKITCARVSCAGPQACNFIKKLTLAQVFSFEFCDIFKNTLHYRLLISVLTPIEETTFSYVTWILKYVLSNLW